METSGVIRPVHQEMFEKFDSHFDINRKVVVISRSTFFSLHFFAPFLPIVLCWLPKLASVQFVLGYHLSRKYDEQTNQANTENLGISKASKQAIPDPATYFQRLLSAN